MIMAPTEGFEPPRAVRPAYGFQDRGITVLPYRLVGISGLEPLTPCL